MFGRKKSKSEENETESAPMPPPAVRQVPAPPPVSSWTPPDVPAPELPASEGEGARAAGAVEVTTDYTGAAVFAANHIVVQGGEGKVVLDVATEMRDQAGGKLLPVAARVVMTVQTAERLVKALEQALTKLKG